MIGHDDIGKDQEVSRSAGFIQRFAGDTLYGVRSKNRQTILGDDGEVERLGVSRDLKLVHDTQGKAPRAVGR